MRQVRYSPQAIQDLDAIFLWIAADDPRAALRILDRIDKTVAVLEIFTPGRRGRLPGARELVVRGLPYVIAYREATDEGEKAAPSSSSLSATPPAAYSANTFTTARSPPASA